MANLKELIVNGVSHFIGKVFINDSHITTINGVEVTENPKFTDTVTTVAYDSTNKKITKTVDGTTSDVVTAATLKTAMGLDNVEANQNAFSNVKVGTTTISADAKTDTLELSAGTNITLTPDATNDKVTINATDTKYSAGDGIGLNGTTFSNTGVTGIKGSAESSYRTGQVNLTAANVGAVATTGNETVSGNKTFSGIITITPSSNFSSQSGVVSANPSSIIQSPIPKYLWHDIWAFCRASTPKYYTSADGSTWVEGTLEKNLFAHKEAWGVSNVLSSSIKGSRWTWLNGGFYASQGSWIVLGVTYKNPSAYFDLLLETSSNGGSTWSTMLSVTNLHYVQTPIWIKNSATCQDSLRLTLTWNNNSASNAVLGLCSIRFLTPRWGDQGKGGEFEYPFAWDGTPNVYPIRNGSSDLGTSSNKWNNVNANNFNGNLTGNVTGNVTGDVTGRTSSMLIQNIASNANLNTITTDGWYMASTDAIASSLSNCPSTKSFLMEVYHINSATGSNEVIYQKISTSENIHYERVKTTGTWSEWKSSCHIDLNGVVYI